jgi:hypothetical protein
MWGDYFKASNPDIYIIAKQYYFVQIGDILLGRNEQNKD